MTDELPSVHQAIAAVMLELPAVAKDSQVSGSEGGYKYRGIEAIKAALKPLLAAHGVHYAPYDIADAVDSTYNVRSGAEWQRIRMVVRYRIYGPAGDYIEAVGRGEGADNSDKACNKAMTVAEKQVLAQVFCIADADGDPDQTRAEEQVPTAARPPVDVKGFKGGLASVLGAPTAKAWWEAHDPGEGPWEADEVDRQIEEAKQWEPPATEPAKPTKAALDRLLASIREAGITDEERHDWATLQLHRTIESFTELTREDVAKLTHDAQEMVSA